MGDAVTCSGDMYAPVPGATPELGRHPVRGVASSACFRDAEVGQLHDAVAANEDVLRLDVAVDDLERVQAREGAEELLEVRERAQRQACARHRGNGARAVSLEDGVERARRR